MQYDFLTSVILYKYGKLSDSLKYIMAIRNCCSYNHDKFSSYNYYKCISDFISLKISGMSLQEIKSFLNIFHTEKMVSRVVNEWAEPDEIIAKLYPPVAGEFSSCKHKHHCKSTTIEQMLNWIAHAFKRAEIDQNSISDIFDDF